jgi:hypothetical protein
MNKKLLFTLSLAGIAGMSFFYNPDRITKYHNDGIETVNFSSNPPAAKTGAPGEGNCTDCHSGSVLSADGVVDFSVGGGPGYIPGNTYTLIVSSIGGAKNGFELTVLDAANNQAGTLTAGANSNVTSSGGREYIRHSSSLGENTWVFEWTAPAEDAGELTAYYTVNKANNDGATSSDEIYVGSTPIPLFGASISENELDASYNAYYNQAAQELNLSYSLPEETKVVLNVQDLSGRLVTFRDFGDQPAGDYNETFQVNNVTANSIYIVSLFVDNTVLNRKIMF